MRVQHNGRPREIGLGSVDEITLAKARDKAHEARKSLAKGIDPTIERQKAKLKVPTFREAAKLVHEEHKAAWPGHLLALHVTPASAEDRGEVERFARTVQAVTNDAVEFAWVDQSYTGERAASAAARHGIALEVVKLPEAKRGLVLLPRRWVVERSFAWRPACDASPKITSATPNTRRTSRRRFRLPHDEADRTPRRRFITASRTNAPTAHPFFASF